MYGLDCSTGVSTSPLRAVGILTLDNFHKISRAVGPQETGMQHAEEANLCAEVSRIARHFEKGFRTGTEQKTVEDLLVLKHQWGQPMGQGEDHVQVAGECEDNV